MILVVSGTSLRGSPSPPCVQVHEQGVVPRGARERSLAVDVARFVTLQPLLLGSTGVFGPLAARVSLARFQLKL